MKKLEVLVAISALLAARVAYSGELLVSLVGYCTAV